MNTAHPARPAIVAWADQTRCFSTGAKAQAWADTHVSFHADVRITEARPPAPTWSLRDQSEDRVAPPVGVGATWGGLNAWADRRAAQRLAKREALPARRAA